MPVEPLMQWKAESARWTKMYKGKTYYVSCKTLGVPPTKGGSIIQANEWWKAKQAETDGMLPPSSSEIITDQIRDILGRIGLEGLQRLVNQGTAAGEMVKIIQGAGEEKLLVTDESERILNHGALVPLPAVDGARTLKLSELANLDSRPQFTDADRQERVAYLKKTVLPDAPLTPGEKTIGKQFVVWAGLQFAAKKSNARKKMNIHMLGFFKEFMGEHTPLEAITEDKWEGFFLWLSKHSTAKDDGYRGRIQATAKNFLHWLHDKRLIELPRNLDNGLLTFEEHARGNQAA